MQRPLLAVASLLLALGSPLNVALAANYYVTNSGAPTGGNGSQANPWGTITEALTSGVLVPGDVVHVDAGNYSLFGAESFPLVVPDGVTLKGASAGVAVVDARGSGADLFQVAAGPGPTAIEGMALVHGTGLNEDLVRVDAGARDVRLRDNLMAGGHRAVEHASSDTASMLLEGNTISGFAEEGLLISVTWNGFTGHYALDVHDNAIDGRGSGRVGASYRVRNSANATLNMSGNTITGAVEDGIRLNVSGTASGHFAYADGVIEGNSITSCGGRGLAIAAYALRGASESIHYAGTVRNNTLSSHGAAGLALSASAEFTSNWAAISAVVEGNTITGNSGDGVLLFERETTIGLAWAALDPDLGGGPSGLLQGRNTIRGNDAGYSTGNFYDVRVDCVSYEQIHAEGNWWGTTSLAAIENHVWHWPDGVPGLVVFDGPLDPALGFSVEPGKVWTGGGDVVTVTADPGSAFVPFDGTGPARVEVGGLPAINVTVAADGSSLRFEAPGLPAAGTTTLAITNPAGQTGNGALEATRLGLSVAGLVAGQTARLTVTDATPNSVVAFVYSLAGFGQTPIAGGLVVVDLADPLAVLGSVTSSPTGTAVLNAPVPAFAAGVDLYLQAGEATALGVALSQPIHRVVQ